MNKNLLARMIFQTAHLTREFKLRSGQISNEYFDKYLFESNPKILSEIVEQMSTNIPVGTEALAGLEMGGIPIATALSLKTGLPVVFIRKKAKEYGTCKLAEGTEIENKRVCVIEDVVTTGGQIILSVNEMRKLGAKIENVMCVILRDPKRYEYLGKEGLKLTPLLTMDELKAAAGKCATNYQYFNASVLPR